MEEGIHRSLGLTDDEFASITSLLGREPNHLELAMYAVMWSEHCSYKSSRIHLKRLPTEAPWVLVGPGENAGVVDVGDGIAAAIRIESHNHPSAIEPYQGAATGVGGILRDIFTMGARPIALMDPLRFGPLDDPRSRWIAEGVVSGVSGYGNSVGVPNVGGETVFDETYQGNPLVNVLCLGLLPTERLVLGQATGVGNLAVLLGSTTGRDGIGGVSVLASAGFSDEATDAAKRPSVQVGDPFEEKRLIEACLELLDAGLVVGIQDLGGAGLACATSETASRGGMGMDVDVNAIARRESGMEPFEVMTSESQERMLAIVEPEDLEAVLGICERWEVRASVIGRVTTGPATGDPAGGRLRILDGWDGEVLADIPAASLHEDAPLYRRPCVAPAAFDETSRVLSTGLPEPTSTDPGAELIEMLADTRWVWSQYDHQLFLNTVEGPGGDAAVLRLKHPGTGADTGHALALTTDGNHRWCAVDPRAGTALTVAESVLNLACVGARPLAVVNCLNFGNPEHPEVMWQLSEAVDGMAEACTAFGIPVIGGNVSLYNESLGSDIDPTPVIGMLGVVDRLDRRPPGVNLVDGGRLLLLGVTQPEVSGSRWARERGHRGGHLPSLDIDMHQRVADVVRTLVAGGLLAGAHDVATGGLGVALAEMASRSGLGVNVARVADAAELFSESPSRVVVCVQPDLLTTVENVCAEAGVPSSRIGVAGGDRVSVKGLLDVALSEVAAAWIGRIPAALGSGTAQDWAARPGDDGHTGRGRVGRYDGRVNEPAAGGTLDRDTPGVDLGEASADDDTPKEACGVFGVFAPDQPVSHLTYLGLYALQHRGQESAGMAVSDGQTVTVVKDMGLVSNAFDDRTLAALTGHLAIGHTRYSTTGSSTWRNAQPVYRDIAAHTVALAHNGNLVNTEDLADELGMLPGTITSDSDVMTEMIATELGKNPETSDDGRALERAVLAVVPRLKGAFSVVAMDENHVVGVRDPHGFRPLCLGKLPHGWVLASESPALDVVGAHMVRELEPGEMIIIDAEGYRSVRAFEPESVDPKLCLFEFVYFSRPDTRLYGQSVHQARVRMGEQLAKQAPAEADLVMGVPESGLPAAEGFARASGIPYGQGLVKNRYIGRTFIAPNQEMRALGVRMKLNPLRDNIAGRKLVVVDDSIVRGTTTRAMVSMLREAGAVEVHMRISSPPYKWPCFYGMDTGSRSQLLAANMEVEEIREYLNVDSLAYLTLDRLHTATGAVGAGFCDACLTGNYPVSVPVSLTKDVLEVPVRTPVAPSSESTFAGLLDGEATLPVDDARDRTDDLSVTVVHDGKGGLGEDHLRA